MTPCAGCGSLNRLHFSIATNTEPPTRLEPCPFDTEEK